MTSLPQVLRNVRVGRRGDDVGPAIADEVAAVEADLAGTGRVLIRPSGTEPLVRIMVEAPTEDECSEILGRLMDVARAELG
jgi:phosphoglucosamine mutase